MKPRSSTSHAPLEKIEAYKASKGWTFPWYSSYGSDFNYDFHATLDESVAPVEYNFQTIDDQDEQSRSTGPEFFPARGR